MNLGYGGANAESSAVTDGRRLSVRTCKNCPNAVYGRSRICSVCHQASFEKDQKRKNERAKARKAAIRQSNEYAGASLSDALSGLQSRWFGIQMGAA